MTLRIRNGRNGNVLAKHLRVARGFWERLRGLLGKTELEEDEALWIPRCRSIHTCFMTFTIDVIFVRGGRVIGLSENLRPFRVFGVRGGSGEVDAVELAASRLSQSDTRLGDHVQWEEY